MYSSICLIPSLNGSTDQWTSELTSRPTRIEHLPLEHLLGLSLELPYPLPRDIELLAELGEGGVLTPARIIVYRACSGRRMTIRLQREMHQRRYSLQGVAPKRTLLRRPGSLRGQCRAPRLPAGWR